MLLAAGPGAQQISPGIEVQGARWRDYLAGEKKILMLDDAAGHEQARPLPGTAGSLMLITSRRRLAALEYATVISLNILTQVRPRNC